MIYSFVFFFTEGCLQVPGYPYIFLSLAFLQKSPIPNIRLAKYTTEPKRSKRYHTRGPTASVKDGVKHAMVQVMNLTYILENDSILDRRICFKKLSNVSGLFFKISPFSQPWLPSLRSRQVRVTLAHPS